MARAISTPHCSSCVRCPTTPPRRLTSTAPTCSTRTRVLRPATSTVGRNEADRALVDVGAIRTTDRGSSASDCTTMPYRRPCCSCPTPLGRRSSWTSPRRTEFFHQTGNGGHLGPIGFVSLQCCDLGGESAAVTKTLGLIHNGPAHRFGLRQTLRFDSAKSPERLVVEPNRYRVCHSGSVSRFVIRHLRSAWHGLRLDYARWSAACTAVAAT